MARKFWVLLLWVGFLSGCGTAHHARSNLRDSARDYNMMVRWQKWQPASGYVESKKRGEWLAERMRGGADLRILDVQLLAVAVTGEDEADVQVAVDYTRAADITLSRRVFVQKWKKVEDMWMLMDEEAAAAAAATDPEPSWP